MAPAILVGTRKGLFVLKGDEARRDWELEGPYLAGWDVFHAMKHDGSISTPPRTTASTARPSSAPTTAARRGSGARASACPRITS